jgi:hypothetical protein
MTFSLPAPVGKPPTVQTKISGRDTQGRVLSQQYIEATGLEERPTEWTGNGRPIYRRLPAIGETYQRDFFAETEIGYVYVPPGFSADSSNSIKVSTFQDGKFLGVGSGKISWELGTNEVNPVIVDLEVLELGSGRQFVGYELIADRASYLQKTFVENGSLEGQPLNITAGTDIYGAWRFPPVNAFITSPDRYWTNYDPSLPDPVQLAPATLGWESPYESSFSRIVLRSPKVVNQIFPITATLYVKFKEEWSVAATSTVQEDAQGQYYEFNLSNPQYVSGWRVAWKTPGITPLITINKLEVTGYLTEKINPQYAKTYASLVIYPENAIPKQVTSSTGELINAVYCPLALIEVNGNYQVQEIQDKRLITQNPYYPVADWLTNYWDQNLMENFSQINNYVKDWMNPESAMLREYGSLEKLGIEVVK